MNKITLLLAFFIAHLTVNAQKTWDFNTNAESWTNHQTGDSPSATVVTHSQGKIIASYAADTELPGIAETSFPITSDGTEDYIAITLLNQNVNAKYLWLRHDKGSLGTGVITYDPVRIKNNSDNGFVTYVFVLDDNEWKNSTNAHDDYRFYLTQTTSNASGNRTIADDPDGEGDLIVDKIEYLTDRPATTKISFINESKNGFLTDVGDSESFAIGTGLTMPMTGGNQRLSSDYWAAENIGTGTGENDLMIIRIKNESANEIMRINSSSFASNAMDFVMSTNDTEVKEYIVPLHQLINSGTNPWTGNVNNFRFNPKTLEGSLGAVTAGTPSGAITTYSTGIISNPTAGDLTIESIEFASSSARWSGATDTDWATTTNWVSGAVPGASDNVTIPSGLSNYPTAAAAVTVASITIDAGAAFTANDAVTANVTIESGGSFIATSTVTGTVTYNRGIDTNNWHLVSSPVSGETMTDIAANNSLLTNGSSVVSFAAYDNTQAVAADRWSYFASGASTTLTDGKGYSTKAADTGDLSFAGSFNDADVTIALTQGGASGTNFNALGNPFTSYVNTGTFLTNETADLDSETIWVWDQENSAYATKVTENAFKLAPGQGFFVEASSTNDVTFTEAMQSHETTDTFLKSSKSEIKLNITDGTSNRYAEIYYIEGATTGFDNGYDGKLFGGFSHDLAVYSKLIAGTNDNKYQIQSLPNTDLEAIVVAIGVIANAGKEITFSAETLNIASGLNVYLEDRFENTFINLSETTHKVTLSENSNSTGRFFLHTKSQGALNTDDFVLDNITIYKKDNSLRIVGAQGKSKVKLFNILGKQILRSSFTANGVKDILLPKLASGIYIVQLETTEGRLNKKIILE
ncbi:T9SS type A sorting domain-containing protein [Polaribacter sp.]|uniref:T9SS type A sorting domain-containing protein n=1 Tax=Polaribacter sp. TaxID=1920175 RepID=UPI0025EA4617|nr:T9SS type A sorting domain-containing protein [Polaribacter sp.]